VPLRLGARPNNPNVDRSKAKSKSKSKSKKKRDPSGGAKKREEEA
jgi:hypothetical protein